MLTDPKLRAQVDKLWDKFWTGGLSNPLDAIEQFSYLLFLKRLDDRENAAERQARRRNAASGGSAESGKGGAPLRPNATHQPRIPEKMRWSVWKQMKAEEMLKHLKTEVFPKLAELSNGESSFGEYMRGAECKINKPSLLVEAVNLIDEMKISEQNQDTQGDLYEYMLGHLSIAGRNGQFRTPRHIIRMMVKMLDPKPRERIGDLAAGTGGFLVNAHQHILEQHTSAGILEYDEEGNPHHLIGDQLSGAERAFMSSPKYLRGYDNDSGMTILRIGSMNLMLHGVESPQFYYRDTLSKAFDDEREYDVILMNPPFKGAVDKGGAHPSLPSDTSKSELLFLHLILRALDMGGRAAVIVPDGVLFGSSRAHVEVRKRLIEENRLDGVVSMPSGVFKPYAGVSTAVLFFTRGARTERIWFYDMAHDGFSLDDKRTKAAENDIPDILDCWKNRHNPDFEAGRAQRILDLRRELTPLKEERLRLQAEVNRLTFESVLSPSPLTPLPKGEGDSLPKNEGDSLPKDEGDSLPKGEGDSLPSPAGRRAGDEGKLAAAQAQLSELESKISKPQSELDRLTRQFWVTAEQARANKYDLSASRYRQADSDAAYHEKPSVTLERLARLESVMAEEIRELGELVNGK
ncbi:MAG: type I restriction-modification system subunit M [Anaerolineales bacterium]|nr:type I restriction-modification system subunit M [Anaerolineales bacterium]